MKIANENDWTSSICRAVEDIQDLEVGSLERRLRSRVLYHAACTGPTGPDGTIESVLQEIETAVNECGIESAQHAVEMVMRDLGQYATPDPSVLDVINAGVALLRSAFFTPDGLFRVNF